MYTVTCIDLQKNTYEVPIEKLRWRPSVYGIIIQEERILLSQQWDGYDLPGGGINLGEGIEVALVREVREETGIQVELHDLVHVDSNFFVHPSHPDDYVQSILIYYTAKVVWWELSTLWFDRDEQKYARLAEWIPLSEIDIIKWASSLDITPIIQKALS